MAAIFLKCAKEPKTNKQTNKKSLNDVLSTFRRQLWTQLNTSRPITRKLHLRLRDKLSLLIARKEYTRVISHTHARTHARTPMFPLSFSVTHTYIHNVVLSASYTWPLISP